MDGELATLVDETAEAMQEWREWLGVRPNDRRYLWSAAEERELRRWYGREDRNSLAMRISRILQQESGDPTAERTVIAVAVHAQQMGLEAYSGEADELNLTEAAELVDVTYAFLIREVGAGRLRASRKGKQKYVKKLDLSIWFVGYRDRAEAIGEMLEVVDGFIGGREARRISGISEVHLSRLVRFGVVKAFKIPDLQFRRGEWAIDRQSLRDYMVARATGRLPEYLRQFPDYVANKDRLNREIRRLRRSQRIGRPDPLTEPKSKFHPGCFQVRQLASHVGLSVQAVYNAARRGDLRLVEKNDRSKIRYAVEPAEARRFAAWIKKRDHGASRWHNRQQRLIRQAGLVTVADLARRWGRSKDTIRRYSRVGLRGHKLAGRSWGRYLVFESADVERFERATGLEVRQNGQQTAKTATGVHPEAAVQIKIASEGGD